MSAATETTVEQLIDEVFTAAGVTGHLHACEIAGGAGEAGGGAGEVAVRADEPAVLASVFKILVGVAFVREVGAGRLDATERVEVGPRYRVGGIGTAGCRDDVTMSWRDLALFMLTMSDNAATDVVYHRLGEAAVQRVISDLELSHTRIVGCCEDLLGSAAEDLHVDVRDLDAGLAAAGSDQLLALSVRDPARTNAASPRDLTRLLAAIWTDRAAAPDECEQLRDIMGQQIWPHRLAAGFGDEVQVAGKTGTLPGIRNEAGVLRYPDGRTFAVAVLTRSDDMALRSPEKDAAIGRTARLAVDHLRGAG